ncbi:hypothetical protein V1515DRAFT_612289 [Lipomyces mesembrius]
MDTCRVLFVLAVFDCTLFSLYLFRFGFLHSLLLVICSSSLTFSIYTLFVHVIVKVLEAIRRWVVLNL